MFGVGINFGVDEHPMNTDAMRVLLCFNRSLARFDFEYDHGPLNAPGNRTAILQTSVWAPVTVGVANHFEAGDEMGGEFQQLDEAEQDDGVVGLQQQGIGLCGLDNKLFPHASENHDDSHQNLETRMPENVSKFLQPRRARQRRTMFDDKQPI